MEWEEKVKVVDKESEKSKVGVGVLVTAHHGQRVYLESCLRSVKDIGWVTLVYDNPGSIKHYPSDKCLALVADFIVKHETRIMPGPTYPQFFNFKIGSQVMDNPLVFVIGADSILEHPENLGDIVEMLMREDGEIIACSSHNPSRHGNTPFCGTKSFLVRNHIFKVLMKKIEETFIPFDHKHGNMENRMGWAIKKLGIKEVRVPELPGEDQFSYGPWDSDGNVLNRGTWGKILGFRHLRGEMVRRQIELQRPVEAKYFDQTYCSAQEKEVLKYWETQDEKEKKIILEKWWSYNPIARKALDEIKNSNLSGVAARGVPALGGDIIQKVGT